MKNILTQEHPAGLYLLFFVEMWERFSYYGMRALLVLYMAEVLMFSPQKAGNIYGFYTGLVYLTPVLGGYLADKYLGQRKCISIGAVMMCTGLFILSSGINTLFIPSLLIMAAANGFFKSNISSVLGMLYADDNAKKDAGFTVFYMGINIGAFFSPLVCGTLAVKYGYEYGFFAAGVGMLAGALCYKIFENKKLKDFGLYPQISVEGKIPQKLTKHQKNRIYALFVLMLFTIVFWVCFEQAGTSLTLFAQYSTDRNFFNINIPASWFQSLNPLYIIIFAPVFSEIWTVLKNKKKEPSSVEKFTIGLALTGVAYAVMTFAGSLSSTGSVSPFWLISVYFIMTAAELCISPIGLSLVSKLAPVQCVSVLMGTWFLTSFFGNLAAGFWGGKYGSMSNEIIFAALAAISFLSAGILACFIPAVKKITGRV